MNWGILRNSDKLSNFAKDCDYSSYSNNESCNTQFEMILDGFRRFAATFTPVPLEPQKKLRNPHNH